MLTVCNGHRSTSGLRVIMMRHAESDPAGENQDHARPITDDGAVAAQQACTSCAVSLFMANICGTASCCSTKDVSRKVGIKVWLQIVGLQLIHFDFDSMCPLIVHVACQTCSISITLIMQGDAQSTCMSLRSPCGCRRPRG